MRCLYALGIAATLALPASGDWPQWRGPLGTGHLPADAPALQSFATPVKVMWTVNAGEGLSSPVVAGGRVYFVDNTGGKEMLHALSAADGKQAWEAAIDDVHKDQQSAPGPRSTPLVDGDRVYMQSCRGKLKSLSTADGSVVWQADYVKEFGAVYIGESGSATGASRHGYDGPPIIDGDRLIACAGGKPGASLVAFDKKTGKVVWKSQDDVPAYVPPVVAEIAGVKQVIEFSAEGVFSVDAVDGRLLWRYPIKTQFGRHAATPIVLGDRVVVSSHQAGLICIQVTRQGDRLAAAQAWTARDLAINFASPVAVLGHLYGIGPRKNLECVEIATGKSAWTKDGLFYGNPGNAYAGMIAMGNNILMLTDGGVAILFAADTSGYRELSRAQVCGTNWCNPAYSDGMLYVRDAKEQRCVRIAP